MELGKLFSKSEKEMPNRYVPHPEYCRGSTWGLSLGSRVMPRVNWKSKNAIGTTFMAALMQMTQVL